ncbi:MAG TPA: outer membrane protein transport protein [Prolixibacteraceae bacterium]|nr:outer membrane protein transport protein [Prolixibacteraceae bacterium]
MKRLVYTISILLMAFGAYSQDLTDALRYSNYHMSGTARSAAMGNAFGALGGDFSSLSINPAGAGVYRSGEFTLTPSFGQTTIKGIYLGNTIEESEYNLSFDNLGYVASFPTGENSESGLISINVGLGFNKLKGFTMNSLAEGSNADHSLLTAFTENANNPNVGFSDFYEQLAWDTDLLLYDEENDEYFNDLTDNGYGHSQRQSTARRGYINEYLLSVAANFNHKFYMGATVGIHDVYFKENTELYEWDEQENIPYFNDLRFKSYLKTAGNGVNLKLGAIFKPIDQLRLGVAFHTPTFYKLNDLYDNSMESSITYDDGVTENTSAVPEKEGVYDYEIVTPMKTILSAALVVGKAGLISVDYEYVDYGTAELKNGSGGYNYFDENQAISKAYKPVGNLHVGGELRVNRSFSLRGGYEYFPSPYKASYLDAYNPNTTTSYSTFAGGFGFRQGGVFFDAAYKHVVSDENTKLYPGAAHMALYDTNKNNVVFTLGFRF